jgi:hypothetical protein
MTQKEFLNKVANGKRDLLQEFIDILEQHHLPYCIIGGLAVNAYADPVVSLDIVVATEKHEELKKFLPSDVSVKQERHSINISSKLSELRIQIRTDHRYQEFINRASQKNVLGYTMLVATPEDVIQGKAWAYQDIERRPSKRQKDLADIMRLVEVNPSLIRVLPTDLQAHISPK